MEPGEIYIADFPEAGPRPVIVVSREDLNRGRYALVVVCTSSRFAIRSQLPSCVPFQAGQFGFTVNCVAQCENILSIEKRQLDLGTGPIGALDPMTAEAEPRLKEIRDLAEHLGGELDPYRVVWLEGKGLPGSEGWRRPRKPSYDCGKGPRKRSSATLTRW